MRWPSEDSVRLAKVTQDPLAVEISNFLEYYAYWRVLYDASLEPLLTGISPFLYPDRDLEGTHEEGKTIEGMHQYLNILIQEYNTLSFNEAGCLKRAAIAAHYLTFQFRQYRKVFRKTYSVSIGALYLAYLYGGLMPYFDTPWREYTGLQIGASVLGYISVCLNGWLLVFGNNSKNWYVGPAVPLTHYRTKLLVLTGMGLTKFVSVTIATLNNHDTLAFSHFHRILSYGVCH